MLNESYSPNMRRLFTPYLKQIGDWFARRDVSVQNLEFEKYPIVTPLTISALCKDGLIYPFISDMDDRYRAVHGTRPDVYYVICKHISGGVSVFQTYYERFRLSKPAYPLELGDVSKKITTVYIAGDRSRSFYDDSSVANVSKKREERSKRKEVRGMGLNKRAVNLIIAINNNPNCKEIRKRARALGFDGAKVYSYYEDGTYHIRADVRLNHRVKGDIEYTIKIGGTWFDKAGSADDDLNLQIDIDVRGLDYNDKCSNLTDYINKYNAFVRELNRIKEFVEFINSFKIRDVLIEVPNES